MRKAVFGVSDEVRCSLVYTVTEEYYRLKLLEKGSIGTVLSM